MQSNLIANRKHLKNIAISASCGNFILNKESTRTFLDAHNLTTQTAPSCATFISCTEGGERWGGRGEDIIGRLLTTLVGHQHIDKFLFHCYMKKMGLFKYSGGVWIDTLKQNSKKEEIFEREKIKSNVAMLTENILSLCPHQFQLSISIIFVPIKIDYSITSKNNSNTSILTCAERHYSRLTIHYEPTSVPNALLKENR